MRASLIGWAAPTGLGSLNRDIANQEWVVRWLAPSHPRLGWEVPPTPPRRAEVSRGTWPIKDRQLGWLVNEVDALVFAEIPFMHPRMLTQVKRKGVKIVCIPMTDQLRWDAEWIELVDLFYCPTKFALEALEKVRTRRREAGKGASYRVAGGWWGVDLERFKFRPRAKAERFLFVNGWGGVANRKGIECVISAAANLPPKSVTIASQRRIGAMSEAFQRIGGVTDNASLYDHGDVLLSPSRFEGLGLQYYEAMACGMPVVVTDAAPMNECGAYRTISAERRSMTNGCNPVYNACSKDLARIHRRPRSR